MKTASTKTTPLNRRALPEPFKMTPKLRKADPAALMEYAVEMATDTADKEAVVLELTLKSPAREHFDTTVNYLVQTRGLTKERAESAAISYFVLYGQQKLAA